MIKEPRSRLKKRRSRKRPLINSQILAGKTRERRLVQWKRVHALGLPPCATPQDYGPVNPSLKSTPDASDLDKTVPADRRAEEESLKALVCAVEVELRMLARKMRRGYSPPPSLETIELVGEMYVRIFDGQLPQIRDQSHFFSVAARTMRWILVSRHQRQKPDVMEGVNDIADEQLQNLDLGELDVALEELAAEKPELAKLIELNYFLGIGPGEIAKITYSSERTVFRDLQRARGWLFWRLGGLDAVDGDPS